MQKGLGKERKRNKEEEVENNMAIPAALILR